MRLHLPLTKHQRHARRVLGAPEPRIKASVLVVGQQEVIPETLDLYLGVGDSSTN